MPELCRHLRPRGLGWQRKLNYRKTYDEVATKRRAAVQTSCFQSLLLGGNIISIRRSPLLSYCGRRLQQPSFCWD